MRAQRAVEVERGGGDEFLSRATSTTRLYSYSSKIIYSTYHSTPSLALLDRLVLLPHLVQQLWRSRTTIPSSCCSLPYYRSTRLTRTSPGSTKAEGSIIPRHFQASATGYRYCRRSIRGQAE